MIVLWLTLTFLVVMYYFWRVCRRKTIFFLLSTKRDISKTPEDFKVPYDLVYFDTADGVELSGWFIEAICESNETFIICGDGFRVSSDLLDETLFLRRRYNLFYFDLRGTGRSKGVYRFGLDECKDIKAAYRFLLANREEFAKRIYIYTCGFTLLSLVLVEDVRFNGAVVKDPYIKPFDEIKKRLKERFGFIRCPQVLKRFLSADIERLVVNTKRINYPTIFISNSQFEVSSQTLNLNSSEEFKEKVFEFFRC